MKELLQHRVDTMLQLVRLSGDGGCGKAPVQTNTPVDDGEEVHANTLTSPCSWMLSHGVTPLTSIVRLSFPVLRCRLRQRPPQ